MRELALTFMKDINNVSSFGATRVYLIYDMITSNDVFGFGSADFGTGSSCSAGCSSSFERGSSFKVVSPSMNNSPSVDDLKLSLLILKTLMILKRNFCFVTKILLIPFEVNVTGYSRFC